MANFHSVQVKDIQRETKDTVAVTFEIPEALQDKFQFIQGQHLTLRKIINQQDIRRTYSLCTSPHEKIWKVAIKQIPGGVFSTFANTQLKKGDTLEIMEPSGHFFVQVDRTSPKNYIAFAAGSGITPILSIIKTHLNQEPNSTLKLFYLSRSAGAISVTEGTEQLTHQFLQRFHAFYLLAKENRDIPLLNGRFDEEKLSVLTQTLIEIQDTNRCFICGPQEM